MEEIKSINLKLKHRKQADKHRRQADQKWINNQLKKDGKISKTKENFRERDGKSEAQFEERFKEV